MKGFRQGLNPKKKPTPQAKPKPPDPRAAAGQPTTKPPTEPAPKPQPATTPPPAPPRRVNPTPIPKTTRPRHAANPDNGGRSTMSDSMRFSDDQSLQRWGANLKGTEEAATEVARLYAEAEAAAARFKTTFTQIRDQGENALPASNRVVADVQALHHRANNAASADAWRAVAADAGGLPATYQREHETDEDRVRAPRRSLEAEKRADVSRASQDI